MTIIKKSNCSNQFDAELDLSQVSLISTSAACLRRELKALLAKPLDLLEPALFFGLIVFILALSVGLENFYKLKNLVFGISWVVLLLVILLSLDNLFKHDYQNGVLEQMVLNAQSLSWLVLIKLTAFWLVYCLPLVLIAPLILFLLDLTDSSCLLLLATFFIGTPILVSIGAIGAAITLSLNKNSLVLSLLILPLYIPVLVLTTSIVLYQQAGYEVYSLFAMLFALLVFCVSFAPFAISAAIRLGME